MSLIRFYIYIFNNRLLEKLMSENERLFGNVLCLAKKYLS